MYDAVLLYENDSNVVFANSSHIEHDDYEVLSEDSDTGEVIGFGKM